MSDVLDRNYVAYGGASELFEATELEVLADSGAGTGKSLAWLQKTNYNCRKYPGSRWFFARDTRKSLTESVLELFENEVLWPGHPAMVGDAKRAGREKYVYPNGSEIILIGLEEVDRHRSTRFDGGVLFEAHEVTEETYELIFGRIGRNFKAPAQMGLDVNPQNEYHWINQRFPKAGEPNPRIEYDKDGDLTISRRRVLFRHSDNPRWYDHARKQWTDDGKLYLKQVLGSLTGATRERLLFHRWVSEDGLIWPEYGESCRVWAKNVPPIKARVCSIDFGKSDITPSCIQIWAVDDLDNAYREAEVYQAGLSPDQIAFTVTELHKRFPFFRGVADCAEPQLIRLLNDRIGEHGGRTVDPVFIGCDKGKGKLHGLLHVRDCLRENRIRFVKDANWHVSIGVGDKPVLVQGIDPRYARGGRWERVPSCTDQEIPGYVWSKREDGDPIKDKPDPSRPNHGCDATEYFAVWKWKKDIDREPKQGWRPPKAEPGKIKFAEASGLMELMEKENWDWKIGD